MTKSPNCGNVWRNSNTKSANRSSAGLQLKAEIERHESRIHFNQERLRELEQQNNRALSDITQSEERRGASEQELASVTERLAGSQAALAQHRETLIARQADLRQVEQDLQQNQEALREAQSQAFGAAQNLSRARNEINALDLQKQGNLVRLEKLAAEKVQLEEERCRLESRLQEFSANVETEKLQAQTQRGTVEERQQRLREIHQQIGAVGQELDQLIREQAEKRSRLNVLEQLQESHEGFSEGALAALKQSDSVLGSLADRIRVPDQFVTAIEAALGHHLQVVLTEQPETACQILADLNAEKKGRASIVSLELRRALSAGPARLAAETEAHRHTSPESYQAAFGVIEAEDSIQPLLRSLLSQTWIVPDLQAATEAWKTSRRPV